jgi:hypothetical protein
MLRANPKDRSAQTNYLNRFPKNIGDFQRLFDAPDFSELYDGEEYIFALRDVAKARPTLVGGILVGLAKDAPQGADALSYLRQVTAKFAVSNTAVFAKLLHGHSEEEVSRVIKYLADVENHSAYAEYPLIIRNLRRIGEVRLAEQFEAARRERRKAPAHGEERDEPSPAGGV